MMQAKEGARKAAKTAESLGPVQRLVQAQEQLEADGLSLPALLGRAALVGLTFGTAFQVTHNNGELPVQSRPCRSTRIFVFSAVPVSLKVDCIVSYSSTLPCLPALSFIGATQQLAQVVSRKSLLLLKQWL